MEAIEGVGDRLKQLRENLGMKQRFAAEKMGVTQPTLSAYENGYRPPNLQVLQKMAELYRVSVEEILQGSKRTLPKHPVELSDLVTDANLTFLGMPLNEPDKKVLHQTLLDIYWQAKMNNRSEE